MGLFGVGGIGFNRERTQVQDAMDVIGAWKSTDSKDCESCMYWASPSETGSKYFGGCRKHQIKVLADRVCDHFDR